MNVYTREMDGERSILASERDIEAAFNLYEPIMQANESGISPELFDFLHKVLDRARIELFDSKNGGGGCSHKTLRRSRHSGLKYVSEVERERAQKRICEYECANRTLEPLCGGLD